MVSIGRAPRLAAVGPIVGLVLFVSTANEAATQRSKGDTEVKYRQSLFTVIGANFGPLESMAEGETPFNAAEALRWAERVAYIAPILKEAFPADSNGAANTSARPEIWSQKAEFDQDLQSFINKAQLLVIASKSSDFAKVKNTVGEVDDACTKCHYDFKFRR